MALIPMIFTAGLLAWTSGADTGPKIAWTVPLPGRLAGLTLVEPWLALDPTDPAHLVGAAMAVGTEGGLRTVAFSSRDGGRSWTVGTNPESGDIFFPSGDPMIDFAPDGTPYLTTLADGFAVWSAPDADTLWQRRGTVPGGSYDRQWLAFDRSGGRHDGRLYTAGKISIQVTGSPAEDVAAFSWSDDGGESYGAPVLVLPDPHEGSLNIVGQLAVLPGGSLVAPFHVIHWPKEGAPPLHLSPAPLDGHVAVLRSDDGRRWDEPVRVGRMLKWGHAHQEPMIKGMAAGGLAVGPVQDGSASLHLVWLDIVDGWLQVVTARSLDGGRSWDPPVRVNRSGRTSNLSNPGVAVDGAGRVAVIWNDRRDDPADRCFRPYVAVSSDGGATFSSEIAVSDEPACPPPGRWLSGGDTQGIVGLPGGGFHAVWIGGAPTPADGLQLHSTRIRVPS